MEGGREEVNVTKLDIVALNPSSPMATSLAFHRIISGHILIHRAANLLHVAPQHPPPAVSFA
eukprot:5786793-Amphidinium_carterae.2